MYKLFFDSVLVGQYNNNEYPVYPSDYFIACEPLSVTYRDTGNGYENGERVYGKATRLEIKSKVKAAE